LGAVVVGSREVWVAGDPGDGSGHAGGSEHRRLGGAVTFPPPKQVVAVVEGHCRRSVGDEFLVGQELGSPSLVTPRKLLAHDADQPGDHGPPVPAQQFDGRVVAGLHQVVAVITIAVPPEHLHRPDGKGLSPRHGPQSLSADGGEDLRVDAEAVEAAGQAPQADQVDPRGAAEGIVVEEDPDSHAVSRSSASASWRSTGRD